MPCPLEQLKAAMFSHSRTDTPYASLLFVVDGQGGLKKPGYMNATLKVCQVRNNHLNYLYSSAFQLFQWYLFTVGCCLGFTEQKAWAFLARKSWTKSIRLAAVCVLPRFCADTVLLSHSSSLSAQLLLHLLVFYKGVHSRGVHSRTALKGKLDETSNCMLLQHYSSWLCAFTWPHAPIRTCTTHVSSCATKMLL